MWRTDKPAAAMRQQRLILEFLHPCSSQFMFLCVGAMYRKRVSSLTNNKIVRHSLLPSIPV